jgi:hypothetical protein
MLTLSITLSYDPLKMQHLKKKTKLRGTLVLNIMIKIISFQICNFLK